MRARATLAATLVVALALIACASALVWVLRANLMFSARDAARQQASATAAGLSATQEQLPNGTVWVGPSPCGVYFAGTGPHDSTSSHSTAPTKPTKPTAPSAATAGCTAPPDRIGPSGAAASPVTRAVGQVVPVVTVVDAGAAPAAGKGPVSLASALRAGHNYAVASEPVLSRTGPARVVSAGVSLLPAERALRTVTWTLVPGVALLLLLVAAVTWLAAGRALRPVAAIRTEVADITARDLHRRVPVPRSRDEIAHLAETMNATLDRLERAAEQQRRFVADASHELRSPLATLRTRLELAELDPVTWPDAATEALDDTLRLSRLSDDLLLLARLDAGGADRGDQVDLGQIAAEDVARRHPKPGVKIELDLESNVIVQGSRAHLARMLTNLLDNAERHAESSVSVRVAADRDDYVALEVADDGAGIPEAERERVFDRFTRLDEARSRDAGGAGLGLAIARDIAARHAGTLTAEESERGARLLARFPAPPRNIRPGAPRWPQRRGMRSPDRGGVAVSEDSQACQLRKGLG